MLYYNQYVRAESLDEAYTLYQKKNNFILAGMLWQKMRNRTMGTAIDLCALGMRQRRSFGSGHMCLCGNWRPMNA